jgi:hypothetical protein
MNDVEAALMLGIDIGHEYNEDAKEAECWRDPLEEQRQELRRAREATREQDRHRPKLKAAPVRRRFIRKIIPQK